MSCNFLALRSTLHSASFCFGCKHTKVSSGSFTREAMPRRQRHGMEKGCRTPMTNHTGAGTVDGTSVTAVSCKHPKESNATNVLQIEGVCKKEYNFRYNFYSTKLTLYSLVQDLRSRSWV